jgi:hypothetical protein
MAYSTPSDLRVLHALRVKGFAETDLVADLAGLPDPEVVGHLETFQAEGLVQRRDGRLSGWSLTSDGRAEAAQRIQDDLGVSGQQAVVDVGYQAFLAVNRRLLEVCSAWQVKDGGMQPNDHTDESYDHKVVQALVDVHGDAAPICASLGGALERFSPYGVRLHAALERVLAGEGDWFTAPLIDSYHTVWFQLHEDLLVSLGIERGGDT